MKKAFTLIELIFVIVILSIIGVISAQIITKIYEQYIMTRAINELETKTELTLTQIAKRLSYRIKPSVIARDLENKQDIKPLNDANSSYEILEWIGYDNDSFRGSWSSIDSNSSIYYPGWSGFIDLDSNETNKTQIKTLGSKLSIARDIIYEKTNHLIDLNSSNNGCAIIFRTLPIDFDVINSYGWNKGYDGNTSQAKDIYTAHAISDDVLAFDGTNKDTNKTVFEQYYLTYSAYAIVPDKNNHSLTFYYDYRPWLGETYINGKESLLLDNVSTFKFKQVDQVIRMKLCVYKIITNDFNISFCKEKVIY
ncbi:type II secretion system protein [Nitrosophilus kaiyonis]|uniref:type II secretion system protein n=1 Tax=Nitrosophilus kaiyonis TaxID=2930200 RepID=UPI002492AEFB|nr:type II secretion system protein [Nitrosophilus kaiyonis]